MAPRSTKNSNKADGSSSREISTLHEEAEAAHIDREELPVDDQQQPDGGAPMHIRSAATNEGNNEAINVGTAYYSVLPST
ncbi:hypothetical protein Pmar_PMAR000105 [Perkinsus marinus ATCC 50983]|uniref:Uncharacterized protein n=1 Tax=Perkinsus marinus (strain ATCC 50983 / TXsc) TaxID=423536 RepID=C5KPX1_PERM5|nr:hypothetical protein Pmar_PMAR000105 [Perkinsus marinus ATCC 50983]EER13518.1 hypothetical protein Pmar_PMAR000105 [Perkinsus marinus ATCC 50983]|eukprot:XP_002781723.1 hypothetical protein Pmar_PMAR000105 [Perkinsus marinus ATCC 50983]